MICRTSVSINPELNIQVSAASSIIFLLRKLLHLAAGTWLRVYHHRFVPQLYIEPSREVTGNVSCYKLVIKSRIRAPPRIIAMASKVNLW